MYSSLRPSPYASAVSSVVTPRSHAPSSSRKASSRGVPFPTWDGDEPMPPKLPQPRTIRDTAVPLRPSARCSIGRSYAAPVVGRPDRSVGRDGEHRGMDDAKLRSVAREARLEAAPFGVAILVANVGLAIVSRREDWQLFGRSDWWVWLIIGAPSALLVATLFIGPQRLGLDHLRREVVIFVLGLLWLGTTAGIACVIGSLMQWQPGGAQLLASAAVVLVTNVLTFSLVFWELDDGGPVARAIAPSRTQPDFQFPQDENPELAPRTWAPALVDYVYVSVTNSIAFSPTDAMPLTHRAKLAMGLESGLSALTVLVVAARAINILGS